MQFNNTVTIYFNTYNDFGEEVVEADKTKPFKCCILEEKKLDRIEDKGNKKTYDMKFIMPSKSFAPYNQVFTDDTVTFGYDSKKYKALLIKPIKDFSGKDKYYEVELEQIKDGN